MSRELQRACGGRVSCRSLDQGEVFGHCQGRTWTGSTRLVYIDQVKTRSSR